jgi:hypothetical protein
MDILVSVLSMAISAVLSGSITWIITIRSSVRKAKSEAFGSDLSNVDKIISMWEHLNGELTKRVSQLEKTVAHLRENSCNKTLCENREAII